MPHAAKRLRYPSSRAVTDRYIAVTATAKKNRLDNTDLNCKRHTGREYLACVLVGFPACTNALILSKYFDVTISQNVISLSSKRGCYLGLMCGAFVLYYNGQSRWYNPERCWTFSKEFPVSLYENWLRGLDCNPCYLFHSDFRVCGMASPI